MAYRFEHGEPVGHAARRILDEQVVGILGALENPGGPGLAEAVHEARRRSKKVRALARMFRTPMGEHYSAVNTCFRDAARRLAALRDAQVAVQTFDSLLAALPRGLSADTMAPVRAELVVRQQHASHDTADASAAFEEAAGLVRKGAKRARRCSVPDGFGALASGLGRTYARTVQDWYACCADPSSASFHEWRKRIKYHRYHVDLLRRVDPDFAEVRRDALHELSDLVGEEHDITVLLQMVLDEPDAFGPVAARRQLMLVAQRRRAFLRTEAIALGARLTAESPASLCERWETAWTVWQLGPS